MRLETNTFTLWARIAGGLLIAACSSDTTTAAKSDASVGASPDGSTGGTTSTDGSVATADCTKETTNYAQVVCAANNFLATLTEAEQATVVYAWTDSAAKTVWSNLPGVTRNGMKLGTMSAAQRATALAVAKTVMSSQGYAHMIGVFAGDDYLNSLQSGGQTGVDGGTTTGGMGGPGGMRGPGGMGGPPDGGGMMGGMTGGGTAGGGYSSDNYSIAFIGTPSKSSDWMIQIGGHHMAFNITYRSGTGYATPHHLGVEPKAQFTVSGNYAGTYQPLNDRGTSMFAIFTNLSDADKSTAYLTGQTFADVLLGPVEYGTGSLAKVVYPTQTGVLVSSLSAAQQARVTTAIGTYVKDYDSSISDSLMTVYTSADAYEKTYVAYGSPKEGEIDPDVNTTYLRIDGPRLWLELSCQAGVVIQGISHFHTIYRDKTEDYGASL